MPRSTLDGPTQAQGQTPSPHAPDLSVQSDTHYRAVFEAAGIGLARVRVDGSFIEVNQRLAEIAGRRRDDLVHLNIHDLTHPDDLPRCQAELQATLAGQQDRFCHDKRLVRPNGECVHVQFNAVLLRDAQGAPQQFVAAIEDLTERRHVQEMMGSAQAAERASEAKTEFLSRMSHELRTPLNAMLGFAQLLRVDPRYPLNDSQRQKVAHIERAGAHLLAMMTDVLDLSRIEAGSLPMTIERLAVSSVLDEAVSMVSNQAAAAQLTLSRSLPDASLYVRADQVRLRQVLVNLLSNAIKYNRPAGHIMIEAMTQDQAVTISVRDTGPGMTPDQLAHLYEPFNRLGAERTAVEGTGIGLVIVRRLLELMHGRIEVSSTPGTGSLFRVWLPLAQAPLAEAPDSGPRSTRSGFGLLDELGQRNLSILYAEDNAVNVELVRQVMRMRPQWQMEVAYNGQQAIDMARASPPDLLLLDMHLGDMSGLDVSDVLAGESATADIPRVALSADAMPDKINETRERGFVDYLTKPLDVPRFLKLLDAFGRAEV